MTSNFRSNETFSALADPKVDIFVDKQLGNGRFHIYHAYLPLTGKEYALKTFPKTQAAEAAYLREKEAISNLNHKNIIKHVSDIRLTDLDHFDSNFILLEYAPYGNFFDLVLKKALIDEKLIRTYFHQLINGVEYMHSQGFAHIDLKLDNFLLGDDFTLKIIDFDQAQKIQEKGLKNRGTACYRAPEILDGKCEDFRSADVYSLGVILYTCKAREFPFVEDNENGVKKLVHYDLFSEENEKFWRTKVADRKNNDFFSKSFKDLVNGMMEKDPSRRFTIQDIKRSRWYKEPIYGEEEMMSKMEKIWERILFQNSRKKGGHSP